MKQNKKYLKFSKLRSMHYKRQIKSTKSLGAEMNFFLSPYTYIKSIYNIETSAIIIFFSQFTRITGNNLTSVYIVLGLLGGLFLASNNKNLILLGALFIFTKSSFDWADGHLAKIKKQTSDLGKLLDNWGAHIGSYSFFCGFGIYLFNRENQQIFLILTLLIIFLKAADLKNYGYQLAMQDIYQEKNKKNILNKLNFNNKLFFKNRKISLLTKIKEFLQSFMDERARTVDFIILLILVDSFYLNIKFLDYFFYFIFFKILLIFIVGVYLTCFKNYLYKK